MVFSVDAYEKKWQFKVFLLFNEKLSVWNQPHALNWESLVRPNSQTYGSFQFYPVCFLIVFLFTKFTCKCQELYRNKRLHYYLVCDLID